MATRSHVEREPAPIPLAVGGIARFTAITAQLPELLEQLRAAPPCGPGTVRAIPHAQGVYLFSERGQSIYVGQTRELRRRHGQHTRASSRHNQATLAFILANKAAAEHPDIDLGRTRKDLDADPSFAPLFRRARERVAAMEFRFIEIRDPEVRTVFEVYATLALGTSEYNSFETH